MDKKTKNEIRNKGNKKKGVIECVFAREVLDSRGNPTVEVVVCSDKNCASSIVPSGASTGSHEAVELRDNDKKRFFGKGVLKAVNNAIKLGEKIRGLDPRQQEVIDKKLIRIDGTPNKRKLGANSILGISMACCVLASKEENLELFEYINRLFYGRDSKKHLRMPTPFSNVINGGIHAGNGLKIQEFMIAPLGINDFKEKVRAISEVYHELKNLLLRKYGRTAINVGDEGGFAPPLNKTRQALELLEKAINNLGYGGGRNSKNRKVFLAIDAAATEFYDKKKRVYLIDNKKMTKEELLDYYVGLVKEYPIISIEDPFEENDFESFSLITKNKVIKKQKVQIVTDDLTVTNPKRIERAIKLRAGNTLLLKINQIGTITEALEAARLAMKNNWNVMVSHRSGETEDTFIADLAVGLGTGQIKIGAPCRGERTAKYNRLLRIDDILKCY